MTGAGVFSPPNTPTVVVLVGLNFHGLRQTQVAGGGADEHVERSRREGPLIFLGIKKFKGAVAERNGDGPGFAGSELNLGETL